MKKKSANGDSNNFNLYFSTPGSSDVNFKDRKSDRSEINSGKIKEAVKEFMPTDQNDKFSTDATDINSIDTFNEDIEFPRKTSDQNPDSENLLIFSGQDGQEKKADAKEAKPKKAKKVKKKKSISARIVRFFFFVFLIGALLGSIGVYSIYLWASNDLPSFSKVADYRPAQVTSVMARDGSLIGQLYREKRYVVTLEEMSPYVPMAFLAVEDSEFYNHPGINILAIFRAFLANLQSGSIQQGGSTITQQVVKRLMLTPEKSYERKIKEAILAFRLEKQLSKDDILLIYLNQIFLGNNAYGVEAAARTYFNKYSKDLTIAEAAMLAGLPQSPSANNPYRYPEAAKDRQEHVLRRMRTLGYISDEEYDKAVHEKLVYGTMATFMGREGGWYLEEVRRQLLEIFNEENSAKFGFDFGIYGADVVYEMGLTVYTSMDPVQQHFADKALRKGLEDATKRHGWLGPIEKIPASEMEKYLKDNPFDLVKFEKNQWQKALVTEVLKAGAKVKIGDFNGYIPVKNMGWARVPDKRVNGLWQGDAIKDATLVLEAGDLIWVSLKLPTESELKKIKNTDEIFTNLTEMTLANAETKTMTLALEQYPKVQGALVAMEPQTGDVVAMVGGYEFSYDGDQFNRATQALRQPGSAFKPVVYSAALDYGFTAGSYILDAPILLQQENSNVVWRPRNFDGVFDGPLRLNRALARSRNLCTIRIAQEMGMESVIQRARDLGFKNEMQPYLAVSLGAGEVLPIDMVSSYSAFANAGQRAVPRLIQKIVGPYGNVLYEQLPAHEESISPQNAFVMAKLLQGVVLYGTSTKAQSLGRPLAGKTGTTNDEIDAWFIGFTPDLVAGAYIGHDQIESMGRGETGTGAALPIFMEYAKEALAYYPDRDFEVPEGIYFDRTERGVSLPFYSGTSMNSGINVIGGQNNETARDAEDIFMQGF